MYASLLSPRMRAGVCLNPQLLERIAPLPLVATGASKKGGCRSSGPLPLTSKPHACSRQSVIFSRCHSTSCHSSATAKRGRSAAWPVRSVLHGRKGLLHVLCAKSDSPPPTSTTTPVVIPDVPTEHVITEPKHWPLLFILNCDAPSAQTLDLPPTSSTEDTTVAEMADVQAGVDRALIPFTGPPEADGSASALAIMDGSA